MGKVEVVEGRYCDYAILVHDCPVCTLTTTPCAVVMGKRCANEECEENFMKAMQVLRDYYGREK